MRFILTFLLFVAVALGSGFGFSWFALEQGAAFGSQRIGPWVAWPAAGTGQPDPYSLAYLARSARAGLSISEGLEFTAKTDSSGTQLSGRCTYLIEGELPPTRFWTLHAIDDEGRLANAPQTPPSLNSQRLLRRDDGSFAIHVSPVLSSGNWLQTNNQTDLQLVLTLYDAPDFAGVGETEQPLPAILLERCAQ